MYLNTEETDFKISVLYHLKWEGEKEMSLYLCLTEGLEENVRNH